MIDFAVAKRQLGYSVRAPRSCDTSPNAAASATQFSNTEELLNHDGVVTQAGGTFGAT